MLAPELMSRYFKNTYLYSQILDISQSERLRRKLGTSFSGKDYQLTLLVILFINQIQITHYLVINFGRVNKTFRMLMVVLGHDVFHIVKMCSSLVIKNIVVITTHTSGKIYTFKAIYKI